MNLTERQFFIRDLIKNVEADLVATAHRLPDEWDGHELRCHIADRFEEAASVSLIRRESRKRRAMDYRNFQRTSPRW